MYRFKKLFTSFDFRISNFYQLYRGSQVQGAPRQGKRKVMKDPVMNDPKHKDKAMPFEMNMEYGDFASIVNLES